MSGPRFELGERGRASLELPSLESSRRGNVRSIDAVSVGTQHHGV